MAIVYAVKSGNWSDPTVWNTGALPTASDDVRSNNFTVTVDGSYTVLTVSNKSETGVTAGGTFSLADGVNLTTTASTGVIGGGTTNGAVSFSLAAPSAATLTANVSGGGGSSSVGVLNSNTGTLTINGNVSGGTSGSPNYGVNNTSSGAVIINGNVTAGSNSLDCSGANNSGLGSITVTGNVTGGAAGGSSFNLHGISNSGNGNVTVTGTAVGGSGSSNGSSYGARNGSVGTLTFIGNANGGSASSTHRCHGVNNEGSGVFTMIGTPSGGSSAFGAANVGSGIMRITGSLQPSSNSCAVSNSSTSGILALTGPFLTSTLGVQAVSSSRWYWKQADQQPTYMQVRTQGDLSIRNLYTADSVGGNPAASNVRSGVAFGPNAELTGTCVIPPAAAVRVGVPVDNTVGTAAVNAQDLWNVLLSSMTVSGSIGERLKGAATAENVAEIVAAAWSEG